MLTPLSYMLYGPPDEDDAELAATPRGRRAPRRRPPAARRGSRSWASYAGDHRVAQLRARHAELSRQRPQVAHRAVRGRARKRTRGVEDLVAVAARDRGAVRIDERQRLAPGAGVRVVLRETRSPRSGRWAGRRSRRRRGRATATWPWATRIGKHGSATVSVDAGLADALVGLAARAPGRTPSSAKKVAQNGSRSKVYIVRGMPTV